MVAWSEYKKIARSRGALALEVFVVESTPCGSPGDVKENLSAHLAYQRDLEDKGVLVLAGPLSDETGEEMAGAGLIIYRAQDMKMAQEIAEEDPMHKNGARKFSLRKWLVNEGSLTFQAGLSTGRISLT